MFDTTTDLAWNVLASPWLEVMNFNAEAKILSPMEALRSASQIRCIVSASPLDLFAAHRFLLTLLYWKADAAGGVEKVRKSLLEGEVPQRVFDGIEAEESCFSLFTGDALFLQDPSLREPQKKDLRPASSLFAEFASGSNVAHFHHGDDDRVRLCVRCATIGMLRVVPWSQAGGAGLTPSVHGAPPIVAIATGRNLMVTLGLNLVPLPTSPGVPQWTGHFAPTNKNAMIPYLEAFTWNPRRIHLRSLDSGNVCWRCGRRGVKSVGPIVFLKNEATKKRSDGNPIEWEDPAAFYSPDSPYKTAKSDGKPDGLKAVDGRDLGRFLDDRRSLVAAVETKNSGHRGWCLVIPCTNPANNKTFDHRSSDLTDLSPEAIRPGLPVQMPDRMRMGIDGWMDPGRPPRMTGATQFVRSAAVLLTHADWNALSAAAYQDMHDSPAAFDVLSGLLWSMREKVSKLPSRGVAWLVLKLMACVPARARVPYADASFCPLWVLPKRQVDECRKGRSGASLYPVSFPRGHKLEAQLRRAIDWNTRQRKPERVDWVGLCYRLDQLID